MPADNPFFTRTMARVHADQGNLTQAALIYRHLLQAGPYQKELADELAAVEHRMDRMAEARLAGLMEQWLALLFALGRTIKLRRLHLRDRDERPGPPAVTGHAETPSIHRRSECENVR